MLVFRVFIGTFLLVSGASKLLRGRRSFEQALGAYDLLPRPLLAPISALIPGMECVIGLALLLGLHTRNSAIAAAAMLLLFSGAMILTMFRGLRVSCGCLGTTSEDEIGPELVARNICLILGLTVLAVNPSTPLALDVRTPFSLLGFFLATLAFATTLLTVSLSFRGISLMRQLSNGEIGRYPPGSH